MLDWPFFISVFILKSFMIDIHKTLKIKTHFIFVFFWPNRAWRPVCPAQVWKAGGAKTTIDIFQLLFPRVAKSMVIMFLHPPGCLEVLATR